jgi:hypothetical protein
LAGNEEDALRGKSLLALALGCLTCSAAASGIEGKWTPEQVLDHDPAWLRSLGLEVAPERLWRREGGGLLEAAVRLGGCSASFISEQGLMITNHHCAFSILQQHSTPDRDLITHGFLAAGRAQELPGTGTRATVPHRMIDVSAQVEEAAAAAGTDDLARYRTIERKKKELVATCEREGKRCEVATYDGGVRYLLIESLEYPDVRLVYAPPRGIGDFGGEADNWTWPRHAGDFALLRVYAAADGRPAPHTATNVPLRPPHFFPVSAHGVRDGDFVMVAGYPGTTYRSLTAPEIRERAELFYPRRAELLRAWLDIMESASSADATARIALADRIKSLANTQKNARGQIDGLRRGQILARKDAADRAVLAWAASRTPSGPPTAVAAAPGGKVAEPSPAAAYRELSQLVERRLATWDRDFLLEQVRLGAKPLDLALTLVRHAHEAAKADLEREPSYMDRNHERLEEGLRRDQTRLHIPTEEALLADLLGRCAALPPAERVPAIEEALAGLPRRAAPGSGRSGSSGSADGSDGAGGAGGAGGTGGAGGAGRSGGSGEAAAAAFERGALLRRATELIAGSRVSDLAERVKMLGETSDQLRARHDPLLDLAAGLDEAIRQTEESSHRFAGAVSRLRPVWQRAVIAHAGRPVAPDANGTLRVSFAQVRGYSPRDGVWMTPQTRLAGLVEKQTGREPFDAPAALLAAAPAAPTSRWADPGLHDVAVDFLADADTTGGSSGSPVLNGRGELVGVNFDRVWENVANDYGYNPEVARNVSVDVRYLLWALTTFEGAAAVPLLDEMGIPAAAPAGSAPPPPPGAPTHQP